MYEIWHQRAYIAWMLLICFFCVNFMVSELGFLVLILQTSHHWANTGVVERVSFSMLECGVHDKLHISSADWLDFLLHLA